MKKVRVGFIILILILLWSYASYADTPILKVSYSKSGEPGDTAKLNILLQNTDSFQSAITSIEGYLNFDKNVFEGVSIDNIENDNGKVQIGTNNNLDLVDLTGFSVSSSLSQLNGDAGFYYNGNPISGNDCKIVIDFVNPIAENTKLFTLNLKVKADADPKEYTDAIEISGFKAYFEDNTITTIDSARLAYTVQGEANPPDNPTNNVINNTIDNNTINNNSINNNTVNNIVNNTTNDIDNKANTDNKVNNNAVNNSTDNKVNNIVNNDTKNNNTNRSSNNSINGKTDDKTISDKSLPYTGIKGVLIPLFILLVIALVIYKKYKEEKID